MGLFGKLKEVLRKTKESLSKKLVELFAKNKLGDEFYEELEDILISSDVSVKTAMNIVENIRDVAIEEKCKDKDYVVKLLKDELYDTLTEAEEVQITPPAVIMMVGVNGVGKTTTIGKLAHRLSGEGKRVLLCAADTFRAAAADQLEIWAGRANVDIVRQHEGADPAAVVFDAASAAKARRADVVLVDTAGRLHNKQNLMNELGKISRIIDRELPNASKEVLLVLDGTTGQNGLIQAEQFSQIAGVTGMVVTKLDGTAKGGTLRE